MKSWISVSLTDHVQANDTANYGYLWWHFRFPFRNGEAAPWAASGNGGNKLFMLPEQDLIVVITSTAFNKSYAHPQSEEIYRDFILKAMP